MKKMKFILLMMLAMLNITINAFTIKIPFKSGYKFLGWYTRQEGGTKVSAVYAEKHHIVVYPHWAKIYNIKIKSLGPGKTSIKSIAVVAGKSIKITAKPKNKKSIFSCWTDASGNIISINSTLTLHKISYNKTIYALFRNKNSNIKPKISINNIDTEYLVGDNFNAKIIANVSAYPIKFSAINLPTGLSLNLRTGLISGTFSKAGTFDTVLTATVIGNSKNSTSIKVRFLVFNAVDITEKWYVDAVNGNDAADGTKRYPKKTIQAAIDSAITGDSIYVLPGIYDSISTYNKSITIYSVEGPNSTIIDGNNANRCILASIGNGEQWRAGQIDDPLYTNTVVVGFTLQNGFSTTQYAAGDGGCVFGGQYINCKLINGTASGGGCACGAILKNCFISGGKSYNGGNIIGCLAINCTIVNGEAWHTAAGAYASVLVNTICDGGAWNGVKGGFDFMYNGQTIINSIVRTVYAFNNDSIGYDSEFVDPANNDYRLNENSSCIDAGNNFYINMPIDLNGNIRIFNENVDIGCYEFTN